jgi:ribosomal-protein-alanine N-acetyltransferase
MRLIHSDSGRFVAGQFTREVWEITREEWLERR